ncbi:MAG TPA: HXXEE domain-containing protein [Flavobacterium sp.]
MTNNLDLLILILPFAFTLHNIEEVFGMEKWTKSIPSFIHSPVTTRQFAIAVSLFTLLGFVIILPKNYYQTEMQYLLIVTGFSGMLFLNVFIPHLIATIYLKKYAPGVITGLLINLPVTIAILWTVYRTQKLTIVEISLSVIIGGIIGVILAFLFLKIGNYIDNKIKK